MKKYFLIQILIFAGFITFSQTPQADTNYINQVTSLTWMPDGKNILLSVVKYHKTDRNAPFFSKVFQYDFQSKKLKPVMDNGSELTPSPDGKMIAYMKRNDDTRADIYLYNLETKQAAYATQQPHNKVMLYDWEKKTTSVLLDQSALKGLL